MGGLRLVPALLVPEQALQFGLFVGAVREADKAVIAIGVLVLEGKVVEHLALGDPGEDLAVNAEAQQH